MQAGRPEQVSIPTCYYQERILVIALRSPSPAEVFRRLYQMTEAQKWRV